MRPTGGARWATPASAAGGGYSKKSLRSWEYGEAIFENAVLKLHKAETDSAFGRGRNY